MGAQTSHRELRVCSVGAQRPLKQGFCIRNLDSVAGYWPILILWEWGVPGEIQCPGGQGTGNKVGRGTRGSCVNEE